MVLVEYAGSFQRDIQEVAAESRGQSRSQLRMVADDSNTGIQYILPSENELGYGIGRVAAGIVIRMEGCWCMRDALAGSDRDDDEGEGDEE